MRTGAEQFGPLEGDICERIASGEPRIHEVLFLEGAIECSPKIVGLPINMVIKSREPGNPE